jgi:GT2 family glycosyltransferase
MSFSGAIIVVNFNSGESLVRCLRSIGEHAPDATVVVVDNASVDGSTDAAALKHPQVELRRNTKNVGFARAMNQGLAAIDAELVLLLNPDCYLTENAVEMLVDELARHPECAAAGPQIRNDDGSVQGSARGDPTLFTGLFGRTTLLTRLFPNSRLARRNVRTDAGLVTSGESYAVDWVSGACLLARRAAVTALGGFDERYFLYWEDADLCRRLRAAGHTIRYVPSSIVVHSGGVSSRGVRALATRAFHESAYTYYATHVAKTSVERLLARMLLAVRCRLKLFADARRE